jgi:hypothetical protein
MARTLISEINGKEWYYNSETDDFEWRVPDVREVIRAKPGHKILAADYSQIEVKIMGFLSQDPDLIIFGEKLNFDYELITLAKSDRSHPRHKELDALRSRTKACTFGIPLRLLLSGVDTSKVICYSGYIK